jgi:hypothetical protein
MTTREYLPRTAVGASPPSSSRPAGVRRPPGERLTGRGGVVVVFGTCFLGLLMAGWANWAELAGAVFFMASTLTAYYVRRSGLLPVVVSPPLLFFTACVLAKTVASGGPFSAFGGTMATLAGSAGWLFAGTGLTIVIAMLRGLPSEVRALVIALRSLGGLASWAFRASRAVRAGAGTTCAP